MESMRHQFLCLFLVWSCIIAAVGGQDIFMAHDEVVRLGDDFTMNCSILADLEHPSVTWKIDHKLFVGSGSWPNVDDTIRPGKFQVAENKYDVIIQQMDGTTADFYECDFGYIIDNKILHNRTYFSLDAVENLQCLREVEIEVSENTWLWCNISYIPDNVYTPRIQLLDESALPILSSNQNTDKRSGFMSHQELITGSPTIHRKLFQCFMDFEPDEDNIQPNYRPPTYTDTCDTVVTVIHAPTNVEIMPRPDGSETLLMSVGQTLTCTASAYPIPSYEWFEGTVDEASTLPEELNDDQQLMVTEAMVGQLNTYTCRVTNEWGTEHRTVQFNARFGSDSSTGGATSLHSNTASLALVIMGMCALMFMTLVNKIYTSRTS